MERIFPSRVPWLNIFTLQARRTARYLAISHGGIALDCYRGRSFHSRGPECSSQMWAKGSNKGCKEQGRILDLLLANHLVSEAKNCKKAVQQDAAIE